MHTIKRTVLITLAIFAAPLLLPACAAGSGSGPDSVRQAMDANRAMTRTGEMADADRAAAEFLVEMADARMMDAREGEVAQARARSPEVRAYGEKMVREQAILLDEIEALAASKNIVLPDRISNAKAAGLQDLRDQTGDDVDETFISMICIDHRRDVKAFRAATTLKDPAVRAFAQRRLPLIEEHLRAIEEIDKSR